MQCIFPGSLRETEHVNNNLLKLFRRENNQQRPYICVLQVGRLGQQFFCWLAGERQNQSAISTKFFVPAAGKEQIKRNTDAQIHQVGEPGSQATFWKKRVGGLIAEGETAPQRETAINIPAAQRMLWA